MRAARLQSRSLPNSVFSISSSLLTVMQSQCLDKRQFESCREKKKDLIMDWILSKICHRCSSKNA